MENEREPLSSQKDEQLIRAIKSGFNLIFESLEDASISDAVIKAAIDQAKVFGGRLEMELLIRRAERKNDEQLMNDPETVEKTITEGQHELQNLIERLPAKMRRTVKAIDRGDPDACQALYEMLPDIKGLVSHYTLETIMGDDDAAA